MTLWARETIRVTEIITGKITYIWDRTTTVKKEKTMPMYSPRSTLRTTTDRKVTIQMTCITTTRMSG